MSMQLDKKKTSFLYLGEVETIVNTVIVNFYIEMARELNKTLGLQISDSEAATIGKNCTAYMLRSTLLAYAVDDTMSHHLCKFKRSNDRFIQYVINSLNMFSLHKSRDMEELYVLIQKANNEIKRVNSNNTRLGPVIEYETLEDIIITLLDPIILIISRIVASAFGDELEHGEYVIRSTNESCTVMILYLGDFRINWFNDNCKGYRYD
jgi:hypothetical protein